VLTRLKIWNVEKRNKRFVKSDKLSAWFDAVLDIDETRFRHGEATRTLLLVMMFLGFRSQESRSILLSEVDLVGSSLRLIDTKNGDEHFVSVGPFLMGHITKTAEAAKRARSKYLFHSKESSTGYIHDIRKVLNDVCATAKIKFSPHDLRRTFVSMLDSMEPAPSHYMTKRLMNHRAKPSDVTAGYIQHEEKKLLRTVTQLEEWILNCAGRTSDGSPIAETSTPPTPPSSH
jgi:integrase